LQTIALQIITDILVTHPSLLAEPANEEEENPLIKPILKAYSRSIKSGDPAVQSLSYFLPVYCHSRAENATRMVTVACSVIAKLATIREAFLEEVADAEEEEDGMVKLSAVGNMLLDWTDPRKIFGFAEATGGPGAAAASADGASETHYLFAETILERLVTSQVSKEEKKVLFSVLGRLHLPPAGCDGERLKTVLELVAEAVDTKVAADATSRNVLAKLQTVLLKQMHDVMTLERGGGGAEETVVESTEVAHDDEEADETVATVAGAGAEATEFESTVVVGRVKQEAENDEEEEEEEDDEDVDGDPSVAQLQAEMKDTTLGIGGTTIGVPDAESTKIVLEDDSEMLDDTDPMDTTA
jgi:condensin complex subunit 3